MNRPFENKNLLILGATPNEIPVVKRAQELGAYVITTDYNTDHILSPAKDVSDECWDISWSSIEELKQKCILRNVNAVLAGYSEIRVANQIKLCRELGLPCYINEEQLEITRDKILFKETCRHYGVPVIKEYKSIDEVDEFPVIVKPTDRAGSIGVGIAYNRTELESAYQVAMEKSLSKRVIIEDYITDAIEMDAHYVVHDGKITLLTTDDIIAASDNVKDGKVVQSVWMYPSKYDEEFLNTVDKPLQDMIRGIGVQNGTIFFSGFVNDKGEFRFFECGFRLWGEQEFEYDFKKVGINYLDVYLYHAFYGHAHGITLNDNPRSKLKGVSLNLYVIGGTISKIQGIQELAGNKDCFLSLVDSYVGQKCTFENAILTKAGLVGFGNEEPSQLKRDVDNAYESIVILDEYGNSMIYDKLDTCRILHWWEKMSYKKAKVSENSHVSGSIIDRLGVRIWDGARVDKSDFDENVAIGSDSIIIKSKLSKGCEIGRRNIISNSQIGIGTSTQSNTTIRFATVGKYCAIAWNVTIGAPNHDFKRLAMAELDHIFPGEDHEHLSSFDTLDCNIGNDVWIAAGAHVLRGVKVSDGSVIAANAVVTKDVPPYAIVAGVPAKIVKYRFSEAQIKSLLDIKWWDFSEEQLIKARQLFDGDLDDETIEQLKRIKGD